MRVLATTTQVAPLASSQRYVQNNIRVRSACLSQAHNSDRRHNRSRHPHTVYIAARTRGNGLHQRPRAGTRRALRPNRRAAPDGQRHVVPAAERRRPGPVGAVDAACQRAGAREHADLAGCVLGRTQIKIYAQAQTITKSLHRELLTSRTPYIVNSPQIHPHRVFSDRVLCQS